MESATQSRFLGGDSLRQVKGWSARSLLNRSDQRIVSAGEPTTVDIEDDAVDVVRCRRNSEKDRRCESDRPNDILVRGECSGGAGSGKGSAQR